MNEKIRAKLIGTVLDDIILVAQALKQERGSEAPLDIPEQPKTVFNENGILFQYIYGRKDRKLKGVFVAKQFPNGDVVIGGSRCNVNAGDKMDREKGIKLALEKIDAYETGGNTIPASLMALSYADPSDDSDGKKRRIYEYVEFMHRCAKYFKGSFVFVEPESLDFQKRHAWTQKIKKGKKVQEKFGICPCCGMRGELGKGCSCCPGFWFTTPEGVAEHEKVAKEMEAEAKAVETGNA